MTQEQLKEFSYKLINTLISKQCYIKGYGNMYRVCDSNHSPVINITKQQFNVLTFNKIIERSELVWVLSIMANPFTNALQVKTPKHYETA